MTLKEKKRKLSEILGINVFESRYKEIDALLEKETEAEKEIEPEATEENQAEETSMEESATEETEESKDNSSNEETETEAEQAEGEDNDETTEGDVTEEEETESEDGSESTAGAEKEAEATEAETTEESDNLEAELFDAKLEAKLLRAGVREDKLEAAKKLFKADHTLADIDKVEKWVKEYPEWIKQKTKEQAKGFGMGVGENDTAETAEDKRLRELGII